MMDSLASIFLRRILPRDIDTIEKVFKDTVTFKKQVITAPMPIITYSRYESQKTIFFEQKTSPPAKLKNNMAKEFKAMKEMMSRLSN